MIFGLGHTSKFRSNKKNNRKTKIYDSVTIRNFCTLRKTPDGCLSSYF